MNYLYPMINSILYHLNLFSFYSYSYYHLVLHLINSVLMILILIIIFMVLNYFLSDLLSNYLLIMDSNSDLMNFISYVCYGYNFYRDVLII